MSSKQGSPDKRQFGRRQTYLHGWVKIPGRPSLACIIRNMSEGGALLVFDQATRLPFSFVLSIDGSSQTYGCEVRHNFGERVGVGFVSIESVQQAKGATGEAGAWMAAKTPPSQR